MLANDITLNTHIYRLTGADLTKSVRTAAPESGSIRTLTVSKTTAKIDGVLNDRFLVRFDLSKPAASGERVKSSCYMVFNTPRNDSTIVPSDNVALLNDLAVLLTSSSNVDALHVLNGEL